MPQYKYVARDISGKRTKGSLVAADTDNLLQQIKEKDLFLISYEAVGNNQGQRLTGKELSDFNRQLGAMLSAGITLVRALEIMMRRDMPKKQLEVYERLYSSLLNGTAMSDAMEQQGRVFPQLLINMYRSAEANGTIDLTAVRMAEHYEKEYKLQKKVKSATTYPIVLLVLTICVVILMFTVVLPNFTTLYGDSELPGITRFVMSISDLFTEHLVLMIAIILLVIFGIKALISVPAVRLKLDKFKLTAPGIGKLMRIIVTARFARTLSSLYASGLSILTTLQISKGTVGNAYIASQFDELVNNVRIGNSLADSLEKVDGFDKKLAATVMVGEESGQLETMLTSTADSYDYEANDATQQMLTIMEPLMIVVMAIVIGGVMIAVLMPMFGMFDQLGL